MRKARVIGLIIFVGAVVAAVVFFLLGYLKPKVAGIYVDTNPAAAVFINGQQVGRTPFRDTQEPGEITIKLIPESFETPLAPYETKINLVSGVETVVKRDFGEFEETSAGEIVSFEKINKDQTSLVVVSIPNSVGLLVDGYQKSITPHKVSSVSSGEHTLLLSANGYFDRSVKVKTHQGYKLTAVVQLALSGEKVESATEEIEEEVEKEAPKPQVEILETSVGFLRVRSEPSTLGKEIGRVEPGQAYNLLDTDEKTGWFKIEFSDEDEEDSEIQTGWISNQYAKKVDEDEITPSATPSPKPTTAS